MFHAVKQARCEEMNVTVQLRARGIAVLANWAQRCGGAGTSVL
jgi:hypothetical protein